MNELLWTLNYYLDYAQIALDNCTIIEQLVAKRKVIDEKVYSPGQASAKEAAEWADITSKINKHTRIVIIFCALSLEAFINDYAINHTSKSYLENHLDRLGLYSKWVVIPRLLTGFQLDTGAQPMQDLDWLITQRNKLVHFKTETVEASKVISKMRFYNEQVAQKALDTVKNVVLALHKIDKEAYINWLKYKGEWFPGNRFASP